MIPARRALAVGAAALLVGAGLSWWRRRGADDDVERVVPGFWSLAFDPIDTGDPVRMADYRGRPLVLNFWATWCPPCVREMPALDRLQAARREAGWRVVGLAVDRAPAVRAFLVRSPVTYDIALAGAAGLELGRRLGNAGGGLPFTAVVDAAGRLRVAHVGEATDDDMRGWTSLLHAA